MVNVATLGNMKHPKTRSLLTQIMDAKTTTLLLPYECFELFS